MSKTNATVLVSLLAVLIGSASAAAQSKHRAGSRDADAKMVEMAQQLPGFGGFFYDEQGRPNVYLADASSQLRLKSMFPEIVTLKGDYDFKTLQGYRMELRPALDLQGVVALDVDERSNRVRVSINQDLHPKGKAQLRRQLMRMSAVPGAVIIDEMPEIVRHSSLLDNVRPIPAGVEIGGPFFGCTMGFNVDGPNAFITASHCTTNQGGVENTQFFQNLFGSAIGVEIVDPPYDVPCTAGRRCRFSDAALIRYNTTALSEPGTIARTLTCDTGVESDREVDGRLTVVGIATASVGEIITKVGKSSGCRRGQVDQTCVDVNIVGTDLTLLCQTAVFALGPPLTLPGDSGSPVFFQEDGTAIALGLLWGGNANGVLMLYSPILQILDELF